MAQRGSLNKLKLIGIKGEQNGKKLIFFPVERESERGEERV